MVRLTRRCHREQRLVRVVGQPQPQVNGHQPQANGQGQHYNFPRREPGLRSRLRGSLQLPVSGKKVERLERRLTEQQGEIQSLRECVTHLRGSLQLSDAQNLALQVMLKKMSKAESRLPHVEKSAFRSQMKKSEQQLENLVQELKEMSQTQYPSINSNNHSGKLSTGAFPHTSTYIQVHFLSPKKMPHLTVSHQALFFLSMEILRMVTLNSRMSY